MTSIEKLKMVAFCLVHMQADVKRSAELINEVVAELEAAPAVVVPDAPWKTATTSWGIRQMIDWAITHKQKLPIKYCDSNGIYSERTISPTSINEYGDVMAYCHLRSEVRKFAVGRIARIAL